MCVCVPAQLCLTLCDPMDCSPPGSSVHGILQTRILEWVAISIFSGSSRPTYQILISCISCIGRQVLRFFTTEAPGTIYQHRSWNKLINLTHNVSIAVKYERIKFLVIALKNAVEIYAWAPKPYHKFMAFKVSRHVITRNKVLFL